MMEVHVGLYKKKFRAELRLLAVASRPEVRPRGSNVANPSEAPQVFEILKIRAKR